MSKTKIDTTKYIKLSFKEELEIRYKDSKIDYIGITYRGWLDTQTIYLSEVSQIDKVIKMLQKAREYFNETN